MGVDVSVTHGLDLVVLDESGRLVLSRARQTLPGLETALREVRPDIVAIDSPPGWTTVGRSRPLERQLARLGISMYATPQDPGDHTGGQVTGAVDPVQHAIGGAELRLVDQLAGHRSLD